MKAYKNSKGVILAVFKNEEGKYTVYQRKDEFSDFIKAKAVYYPPRDTRAEAEIDLTAAVFQRKDKSYKLIDFKG
jgi:hypothetical protein